MKNVQSRNLKALYSISRERYIDLIYQTDLRTRPYRYDWSTISSSIIIAQSLPFAIQSDKISSFSIDSDMIPFLR